MKQKIILCIFVALYAIISTAGCLTTEGFEQYENNEILGTLPDSTVWMGGKYLYTGPMSPEYEGFIIFSDKIEINGVYTLYEKDFEEPAEKFLIFRHTSLQGEFKIILVNENNDVTVLYDSKTNKDEKIVNQSVLILFEEGNQKVRIVGNNAVLKGALLEMY